MNSSAEFDFVVFGGGFGGSIMAMILRRLGYAVLLLEHGKHPRFAIGESSTPFANLLLETIGERYDLPFLRSLSEWGSWQKSFPRLSCGLKRGFTFYRHEVRRPVALQDRKRQLLVAASPNDQVADTHWYRPEFDLFLFEQARALGVICHEKVTITEISNRGAAWRVAGSAAGARFEFTAGFAIDASGANGVFPKTLGLSEVGFASMPATRGIYAHFRNVRRVDEMHPELCAPELPYPPDDAAVHHVFDEGWAWVLRFNNGVTSAGAALKTNPAGASDSQTGEALWLALLERYPSLREQFAEAKPASPFYKVDRLSFCRDHAAGKNWVLLPSTAGFVDPLLSTGFALNLLGMVRLGEIFEDPWHDIESRLQAYSETTLNELRASADLVSALYSKLSAFEEFALLSLVYFIAMSYTETMWRLGKKASASGFLLTNNAEFNGFREHLCARARKGSNITHADILPFGRWDVAGLTDWSRDHWYPVRMQDLIERRERIGVSVTELEDLFARLSLSGSAPAQFVHPSKDSLTNPE